MSTKVDSTAIAMMLDMKPGRMIFSVLIAIGIVLFFHVSSHSESKDSFSLSVTVVDDCIISNSGTMQMSNYADGSSGDTGAQTDFNFLCGLDIPFSVQMQAGDVQIYDNVITQNDFGDQFHVEVAEDKSYVIEKCDPLTDVPKTGNTMNVDNLMGGSSSSTGAGPDFLNVTVEW